MLLKRYRNYPLEYDHLTEIDGITFPDRVSCLAYNKII